MATESVTKERYQDEETDSSSRKRREGARGPGKSLPARHDTHLLDEFWRGKGASERSRTSPRTPRGVGARKGEEKRASGGQRETGERRERRKRGRGGEGETAEQSQDLIRAWQWSLQGMLWN